MGVETACAPPVFYDPVLPGFLHEKIMNMHVVTYPVEYI